MNMTATPSNRLYNGDCNGVREALVFHRSALLEEAAIQEKLRMKHNRPEWIDLENSLRSSADKISALLEEYDKIVLTAEKNLLAKWASSPDGEVAETASKLIDGDWSGLAI